MSAPRCRRLEGKVAVVTASTAGIGLGIVRRLAQEGARVVVSSRKAATVEETVAALRREGLEVAGTACHVGDKAALQRLIQFTLDTYGKIDILVSNAAVNPAAGPILSMEDSAIQKIVDINIVSAVLLAKLAVPHMPSGGSIVFVSSYTAFNPSPPIAMYAVSKTALLGLTKALAEELGPQQGIRVNCLAPGIVPTKFASALVASLELEELNKSRTLLGRLGTPGDMAAAVAFLASEDAAYITGEALVVAGGMQSRL
ncbi:tropinone reductase-like 3 [Micractinium conductrix]|uniref:Tropinone reductase-like 3 n=1 Tax=Micractinium conductrix TaxID=554055 RepID=A0A2P6V6H2_9CHLO|nr:tropinone reductase-like 3 [Micractinium conductrix]|eukprot:PSC69687.1 tropinone reductase-like 3 [Micractinium conductrix]